MRKKLNNALLQVNYIFFRKGNSLSIFLIRTGGIDLYIKEHVFAIKEDDQRAIGVAYRA